MNEATFRKTIWDYYKKNKRDLPWRNTKDPYKILVSEIMLQQTQVSRVINKYEQFIKEFPDFESLAKAPFSKVLMLWSGLGYNRRALYLQKTASIVQNNYKGILPKDSKILETFSGIGKNTAGSVVAFSFNTPDVFIETNIRRVFIHFFFNNKEQVHDKDILKLVEQTLDKVNPREWYYALMDYGSMLSKIVENPNRKSMHYVKQSKFDGSLRQVRGQILKKLLTSSFAKRDFILESPLRKDLIEKAFSQLEKEKFITITNKGIVMINS